MTTRTMYWWLVALILVAGCCAGPLFAQCKLAETQVQGEPAIMLENSLVQLRIRPTRGGSVDQFVYKPTGKSLTTTTDAVLLTDRVWNYANRDIYRQWTSAVYTYKLAPGEKTAAVTLSCRGSAGIGSRLTFEKKISLSAGSAAVRADYALHLGHEAMKPHRAGIWWHNQLGVPQEATTYYVPTLRGIQSLAYGAGASGQYWWYDLARGWGAALGKSGTGVAAIMDYRKLMCFYHYMHGEVAMMEWAYRSEEIENGGAAQTTIWLVPFAGLKAVSGAGSEVVGEIEAPEKAAPADAKAGVPVTIRMTAPRKWQAQVKVSWWRLPDGEPTIEKPFAAALSSSEVAAHQLKLQLPEAGTYAVRAEIMDGDKLAADLFASVVVGEASGEMVIAPIEEPLGRAAERFEDKIASADAIAKYVPPSEEIVTPHVKWAKPYAGGKLRALILNDLLTGRETIELAQRLDMDYVAPRLSSPYSMRGGADAPVWGIVRERLGDEWDVILISGLRGEIFPDDVVEMILEKVRGGTGLIIVNPNNNSDALWAVLPFSGGPVGSRPKNKWQPVAQHYLTVGIPWAEMPPTDTGQYEAAGEVLVKAGKLPLLATRELGKGRIICLGYATSWQGAGFYANGITPWIQFAPTKFAYWEYYFSLLAKCMTWAAQKEPVVQVTAATLGKETYDARGEEPPTVKLALNNTAKAVELVARVTISDEYGHFVRRFDKSLMVEPGQNDSNILLPHLYGGLHLADIIIEDEAGAKVTWATVPVHVSAPVAIAEMKVADEIYRRGDTVAAELTFAATDEAPGEVQLIASLTDAYGRLILRQEQQAATNAPCKLALKMSEPLATTAVLRVEVHDDAGLLSAAEQTILTMPVAWDRREWGAFRSGMWGSPVGAYSREYLQASAAERLKIAGVDSVTTSSSWPHDGEHRTAFEAGFQSLPMGVAYDVLSTKARPESEIPVFPKAKEEYVRTHDKKFLQRPWSLEADDTRQHSAEWIDKVTAAVAKYRPVSYICGDELSYTYYVTPYDYDFGPASLAKFRQWLQTQYATLAALNDEWDTDFATWEEVMPMTTEEVRDRGNYAPWGDHRAYNDVTFADFLRFVDSTLESSDPGARLGTSGSQRASAYGGFDWWQLTDAFDFIQAYDHKNSGEMHRSFHDMLAAPWWGYGATDPALSHQLWRRLLNGNTGAMCFAYRNMLQPDYTYSQTFAEGTVHLCEMQNGLARLLGSCDERVTDVYVHYSQPSIRAAFITGGEPVFMSNREGWLKAIEDSGLQMKFLAYAQIEAGKLTELMPPVLLLPYSLAISDAEAAELQKYVEAGGVLIADARCGLMDEHCKTRDEAVLDKLFGIERTEVDPTPKRVPGEAKFSTALGECDPTAISFDEMSGDTTVKVAGGTALGQMADTPILIVRNVGKGKAVLLNLFMDGYNRRRKLGIEAPLQALLNEALDLADVGPFAQVRSSQADHFYVVRYASGEADYVAILREPSTILTGGGPGSDKAGDAARNSLVKAGFPQKAHLYDLRGGEYLGQTDAASKLMAPGYCQIYSLLPYQVKAVTVTPRARTKQAGRSVSYRVAVQTDGAEPGHHVFRVEVIAPDGARDYYGTQISAPSGSGEAEFALALNDAPGTWQIKATDIATGVTGTAEFTVTKPD